MEQKELISFEDFCIKLSLDINVTSAFKKHLDDTNTDRHKQRTKDEWLSLLHGF